MKKLYFRFFIPIFLLSIIASANNPLENLDAPKSFHNSLVGSPSIDDEISIESISNFVAEFDDWLIAENLALACGYTITSSSGLESCEGDSVTFSITTTYDATDATYQWLRNGNPISGANSATYVTSTLPVGNNNISVMVTNGNGIANCPGETITSNTITVTVNAIRNVSFNITGPTEVCEGQNATYSIVNNNTKVNVGSGSLYRWFVGTTEVSSGIDQTSYTSNTIPDGEVVSLQIESSVKCAVPSPQTSNNTITLDVKENPTIELPQASDNNQSVCVDTEINPISFRIGGDATNANVTDLPPGLQTSFTPGNPGILTIDRFVTAPGSYDFTVTTTGGNCTPHASIDMSITILPDATLTLVSGSETQEVCADEDIEDIVYQVGGSYTSVNVTPNLPSGISGTLNSTTGVYTISGSSNDFDTHDFTITASGDCDNVQSTGTIVINENLTPEVTISSSDEDNVICDGDQVDFGILTQSNTGDLPGYQWQIKKASQSSFSNVNGETNTTLSLSNLENQDEIRLELTSSEDCTASNPVYSDPIVIAVTDNETPTISINATSATTICQNGTVSFEIDTQNFPGDTPSYRWLVNGSSQGTGTTFDYSSFQDGDPVQLELTSDYICIDGSNKVLSNIIDIEVLEDATITLTSGDPDQEICTSGTNSAISPIQYTLNEGATGATITTTPSSGIDLSGTFTNGVYTVTGTASAAGTYNYTVSTNGCGTPATASGTIMVYESAPSAPASINGSSFIICPVSTETYSVTDDPNVSSYTWSFPNGFTITSGQGENNVTVNISTNAVQGQISVVASNPCGSYNLTEQVNLGSVSADAGPDFYVCSNISEIQLQGDVEGVRESKYGQDWQWVDDPLFSGGNFRKSGGSNATFQTAFYSFPNDAGPGDTITLTIETADPSGNNDCDEARDTMSIFILNNPTASVATITNGSPICEGGDSGFVITANAFPNLEVTVGYTLNGSAQTANITMNGSGTGTANIPLNGLTSDQNIELNSIVYTNVTSCYNPITTNNFASISVNPLEVAEAGDNLEACSSATPAAITLSGSSVSGGATQGQWTTTGGGILSETSFVNEPATVTYTPAENETGTITFTLTTNAAGSCPAVSDTRQLVISQEVTTDAGGDQTICSDGSASLVGNVTGGATTGSWSGGSGSFGNANSLSTTYTPDTSEYGSTVTLTLTSADPAGPCDAVSDTVQITIEAKATINAGSDLDVCSDSTGIPLAGTVTGSTSISWTASSGSFVDNTITNAVYIPDPTVSGNVNLRLTAAATINCPEVFDEITVRVYEAAEVEAGPDITICAGQEATMAAVLDGPEHSGTWSADNGNTVANDEGSFTNNSATAEYAPSAADIAAGSVTITYTFSPNGNNNPCDDATDTLILTINPAPTVDVGVDQTVCTDGEVGITANLTGVTTGLWSTSGGGSFDDPNSPTTNYNAGSTSGTVTVTFTTNDASGLCDDVSDSVDIIIKEAPSINLQPQNAGKCASETVTFEVGANGDDLTYQWYYYETDPANATALANGGFISGATSNILNIDQVMTTDSGNYYVTVSGNASCNPIDSDHVILNVSQEIFITEQPTDITVCEGSDDVEFSVVATGDNLEYEWYENGVLLSDDANISGSTTATLNLDNVTTSNSPKEYYVIISNSAGVCPTITSFNAVLNVTPQPSITSFTYTAEICSNSGSVTGDLVGLQTIYEGGTYSQGSGAGSLEIDDTTGAINPLTSAPGTYTVNYTTPIIGGCESVVFQSNSFTITELPTATINYGDPATFCETDATDVEVTFSDTAGDYTTNATFSYTATSGGPTLNLNPSTGTITPNGSSVGTYIITYNIPDEGGCLPTDPTTTITINQSPSVDAGEDSLEVCISNTVQLSGSVGGGASSAQWITDGDGQFSDTEEGTRTDTSTNLNAFYFPGTNDIDTSSVTLTLTTTDASDGCANISDDIILNVFEEASITDMNTNVEICNGDSVTLTAIVAGGASTGSWSSDGEATSISGNTYTPTGNDIPTGSSPLEINLTFETNDPTGPCPAVSESFTITVYPQTGVNVTPDNDSVQAVCEDQTINPTVVISGGATSGTWETTGDGSFDDENSLSPIYSPGNSDLSSSSNIRLTFTSNDPDGPCIEASDYVEYTVDPRPVGGQLSFGSAGRLFLICEDPVPGSYTEALTLAGMTGTIVRWQYRSSTATSWSTVMSGSTIFNGTQLSTTQLANIIATTDQSTVFRVEIESGVCSPNAFSETGIISVIPSDIKPSPVEVSEDIICFGEEVTLYSETGYGETFGKFEGGAFDNSSITNFGWRITDKNGNSDYNFSSDADNRVPEKWLRTNPHPFTTANLNSPYSTTDKLWRSNPDNAGNKGFAIVSGDNSSTLETSVFSLSELDEAILTFDQAYNLTDPGTKIEVWLSTTGGATNTTGSGGSYDILLYDLEGPVASGNEDRFSTGPAGINKMTFDLGDYLGYPNLRVMFKYTGTRVGDIWAVDNIKVPDGPRDVAQEWNDTTDPENPIFIGNSNTEVWTPTKIGWNTFQITTLIILDSAGNACTSVQNSEEVQVFAFDEYTSTALTSDTGTCGITKTLITAEVSGVQQGVITDYPTADGYIGEWDIVGPAGWTISNTDTSLNGTVEPINNPNITFEADDLGAYTFTWTLVPTMQDENGQILSNLDCPPNLEPADLELIDCSTLDWDGIDDHVDFGDVFDLTGQFSIEVWVKSGGLDAANTNNNNATILSKHVPGSNSGYSLFLDGNSPSFTIYNGAGSTTLKAPAGYVMGQGGKEIWHHIAVTYDNSTLRLYVDGLEARSTSSSAITANDHDFMLGAKSDGVASFEPGTLFKGFMDELRIWNTALNEQQIREMMNQEITNTGGVTGAVIGLPISDSLNWSNLMGYYQMNVMLWDHTTDCIDNPTQGNDVQNGFLQDNSGNGNNGRLRLIETQQLEHAPLPYTSNQAVANGNWNSTNSWDYGDVRGIPNDRGFGNTDIDWNIVATCNNMLADGKARANAKESNIDYVVLGLISLQGELTVADTGTQDETNNGNGLWVTHYLKLDGIIDLIGEAQLVQKPYYITYDADGIVQSIEQENDSQLDPASTGYIERDQQGQTNLHNYNYFSSPVSSQGGINGGYTVDAVLHDGTNSASPMNIGWIPDNDAGATTNPIKNSTRWIYKYFDNPENTYLEWEYMAQGGYIEAGIGFTIKGSGVTTKPQQNYVYMGMPNNSTIPLGIGSGRQTMVGNPYPSAISVAQFITDNSSKIQGELYYWEHFSSNVTHILEDYEGGYAVQNLIGALPPYIPSSANPTVDGFFVSGLGSLTKTPGPYIPVGQGFFVTALNAGGDVEFRNTQRYFEREAPGKSVFTKTREASSIVEINKVEVNSGIKRIRMAIGLPQGHVRPLLLGFISSATDDVDYGYDARANDAQAPDDGFWEIKGEDYVIQGVGEFDKTKMYPLAIYSRDGGEFMIQPYEFENFEEIPDVYLFDAYEDTYTLMNDVPMRFTLSADTEVRDRFYVTFQSDSTLDVKEEGQIEDNIVVNYLQDEEIILVKTPENIRPKQIYLINLLGQTVRSWNATNLPMTHELRIPVSQVSDGNYIIKLETDMGTVNKKVVIKQ